MAPGQWDVSVEGSLELRGGDVCRRHTHDSSGEVSHGVSKFPEKIKLPLTEKKLRPHHLHRVGTDLAKGTLKPCATMTSAFAMHPYLPPVLSPFQIAVCAHSAADTRDISTLLESLPPDFPVPVVIFPGRLAGDTSSVAARLQGRCALRVVAAQAGDAIHAGTIYLVAADVHLVIKSDLTFGLGNGWTASLLRSAADQLFESAARVYKGRVVGILLGRTGHTGVAGGGTLMRLGGLLISQAQDTDAWYEPGPSILAESGFYKLPVSLIGLVLTALVMPRLRQISPFAPAHSGGASFTHPKKGDIMRTDSMLRNDVTAELSWQPSLRNEEIGVAVKDGVVTLTGEVTSFARKCDAEHAAKSVHGVRAVAIDLPVKFPNSLAHSDTQIAHQALKALQWDIDVPDESVMLRVEDGKVTLEGEVEWQFQKAAAERAIRYLAGVRSVTSRISVKSKKVSTQDVTQKIKDAFKRSADLDSRLINVESLDGKVVLKGQVRSWAERRDAENAAWAALGVTEVDDRLLVSL